MFFGQPFYPRTPEEDKTVVRADLKTDDTKAFPSVPQQGQFNGQVQGQAQEQVQGQVQGQAQGQAVGLTRLQALQGTEGRRFRRFSDNNMTTDYTEKIIHGQDAKIEEVPYQVR